MKKTGIFLAQLLPAVLVFAMILTFAREPALAEIPDRLASVEAAASDESKKAETPDEETEGSAALPAETKAEVEPPAQAVGNFEDGVFTGSGTGYGGEITVSVTVEDGSITAIEILSRDGETEPFFTHALRVVDDILLQQSWEVDAVSGATFSSDGLMAAVKNALTGEVTESETAPQPTGNAAALVTTIYTAPSAYQDGTWTGCAEGFGGTVSVAVTISGGKISEISITGAAGETPSYLTQASGLIPKMLSAQSPNVDAVSGATYSSMGIINAVKGALTKAAADGGADAETEETAPAESGSGTEEEQPAELEEEAGTEVTEETFETLVTVLPDACEDFEPYEMTLTMTVRQTVARTQMATDSGTVLDIIRTERTLLSASYTYSGDGSNSRYLERAWKGLYDHLINAEEVDAVSGATCSSDAFAEGWEDLLEQAGIGVTVEAVLAQGTAAADTASPETEEAEEEAFEATGTGAAAEDRQDPSEKEAEE